jgi:CBS domain-containing protein
VTVNVGTVSAVMTADPITVSARTPFKDIAELLTGNGISAVGAAPHSTRLAAAVRGFGSQVLPLPSSAERARYVAESLLIGLAAAKRKKP